MISGEVGKGNVEATHLKRKLEQVAKGSQYDPLGLKLGKTGLPIQDSLNWSLPFKVDDWDEEMENRFNQFIEMIRQHDITENVDVHDGFLFKK